MTKQVDVLLGESKGIEKKSTATQSSTKKEGASFFDTMLADAKVKTSTNASTSSASKETTAKTTSVDNQAKKENKTEKTQQSKSVDTSSTQQDEKNTNVKNSSVSKEENTSNTSQEQKTESKTPSTSSLLDRMVVQAKQEIPTQKSKVVKKEDVLEENKETKKASKQDNKASEEIKNNKKEAVASKTIANNPQTQVNSVEENESNEKNEAVIKATSTDESSKVDLKKIEQTQKQEQKESSVVKQAVSSTEDESAQEQKDKKTVSNQNNSSIKQEVIEAKASVQEELENVKQSLSQEQKNISQKSDSKEIKESVKEAGVTKSETSLKTALSNQTPVENEKNSTITQKTVVNEKTKAKQVGQSNTEATLAKELPSDQQESKLAQTSDKKVVSQSNETATQQDSKVLNESKNTAVENVKNQKVANELSKLNQNERSSDEVKVSKEQLLNSENKEPKKEKLSLLDKLINETKAKIANDSEASSSKEELAKNSKPLNNDIITNIYLSSRNKKSEEKSLETLHKGKNEALNAKNVADVQQSAKTLDLGLKETSVETKAATTQTNEVLDRNLQRLAFSKNQTHDDISNLEVYSKKVSKEASKAVLGETVVNLNVSAQNVQNITQRIIGARQQMSSMMSDIAREMYSNYKPPVTAFRLNLQPAHLGSIAIMIKSDRESTISISMNMSSSATLDAMTENQGSLRSALNKSFGQDNQFDLDFGMQEEQQNSNSDQSNQQQNQQDRRREQTSTQSLLGAREENKEEMLMNYM